MAMQWKRWSGERQTGGSVPTCLKECPRSKDKLGRLRELLKILRRGAETTAGGWTGSMDG